MRHTLVEYIKKNVTKDTYFLTADLGYGVLEPLQEKMKGKFINVGISEQAMIGMAAGLALSGKEVYTFTIAAFYLRCLEQIKLDLCYQDVPATMIGTGNDMEYEELGTTHYSDDVIPVFSQLKNIEICRPKTKVDLLKILETKATRPRYIQISRFGDIEDSFDSVINTDKYLKFLPEANENR